MKFILTILFSFICGIESTYNHELAHRNLNISGLAYCVENYNDRIKDWTCKTCLQQSFHPKQTYTFHNEITNTNGFVSYFSDTKELVVSYSGTNSKSMKNWIDDINMIKTIVYDICPTGCSVHKGFYNAYLSVKDEVYKHIQTILSQQSIVKQITFTGHSLGSALATLTFSDLYSNNLIPKTIPIYLYVYGSPRVGGYSFMDYYDRLLYENELEHFRVVHYKDPVPHLPMSTTDFYGVGTEVFYKTIFDKDSYILCTKDNSNTHDRIKMMEVENCSNQYYLDLQISNHLDYFDFTFDTSVNC